MKMRDPILKISLYMILVHQRPFNVLLIKSNYQVASNITENLVRQVLLA